MFPKPSQAEGAGGRMENKKKGRLEPKNLVLELCLRLSLKDYKTRIATKRAWIIRFWSCLKSDLVNG